LRPQTPIAVGSTQEYAWADPVRFRQVLRNLISNARRYGGASITVEVERRGDVVAVAVVDDGPGVPEDRELAIFEAYERGHANLTQPGSVGLGLTVSRQLARMMDGDLTFERRDSMTRFELTVPACVGAQLVVERAPEREIPVVVAAIA
jgi:signal transduction histidine kinase